MNQLPAPLDVNKLKGILGNAKKIMNKVEAVNPTVLSEMTQRQVDSEERLEQSMPLTATESRGYNEEMVRNSKLPDAVKKLMISKPIPPASMSMASVISGDLLDEEEGDEKPLIFSNKPKKLAQKPINEIAQRGNSDMITVSKTQLNEMINEKLLEFFTKSYNKTLIEDTIKRTVSTLIKEGKMTVKKKTL